MTPQSPSHHSPSTRPSGTCYCAITTRVYCCWTCEQQSPAVYCLGSHRSGVDGVFIIVLQSRTAHGGLTRIRLPGAGRESMGNSGKNQKTTLARVRNCASSHMASSEIPSSRMWGGNDPERTILCPHEAPFCSRPHKRFVVLPVVSAHGGHPRPWRFNVSCGNVAQ
jgi:hypothetical protein